MEAWEAGEEPGSRRKLYAPSAERNRDDILSGLSGILPSQGLALEIASGTGQHVVHFAKHLPELTWQPTDTEPSLLASIEAWRIESGLPNILPAIRLDASDDNWPVSSADAIVCSNMIHIAPWAAYQGLAAGAGRTLSPGGLLALYGAYIISGRPTAPSNLEFDALLRAHNPLWGVRNLSDVTAEAGKQGLRFERVVDMPGNNFLVVFRKRRPQVPGM
ncbi:MAG TPA: DUF938 domain-containing protein [Armatimonadota bacterium]|nr:DUF938 domain-containing protein [Armatimonadota bacterium]